MILFLACLAKLYPVNSTELTRQGASYRLRFSRLILADWRVKMKIKLLHAIINQIARLQSPDENNVQAAKMALTDLAKEFLPSGSGFDCGTEIDFDRSNLKRIVFVMSFHHMNEGGYYDGWTEHKITIIPDWVGVEFKSISGRDRNGIKDYIADTLLSCLHTEIIATFNPVAKCYSFDRVRAQ